MLGKTFVALGIFGLAAGIVVGCGTDTVSGTPDGDGGETPTGDGGKINTTPDAGDGTDAGNDAGPTAPETYAVGVTVKGLKGTGLIVQNNGGDDLSINANGTFVFSAKVAKGAPYAVTVKNQPTAPAQKCTISGGTGTIGTGNVTSVVVDCADDKFAVGGTVSGLAGGGVVLQNNAGDDITVSANGSFAFPATLPEGANYDVTVKTQPTNLSQTCTVTSGSGTIGTTDVASISVVCVTNKFTVGGSVSGLKGTGLSLQNKAGDDINVAADGNFTFPTALDDGSDFAVTVHGTPTNPEQTCIVTGGTGKLAGGKVTTVTVNCSTDKFTIGGKVTGLAGTGLVLQNNAGDDIPVGANGDFAFPGTIEDLGAYSVTVKAQPTNKWQTCTVASGTGNVAAANVTNVAVTCTTNVYKVKGSVTGLEGTGLVLQNNAGGDLPIAANGDYEFTTPVASGDGYLVTVLANPANKSQTCTVTSGTGTIGGSDANFAVTCVTNKYSVGVNVTGLVGSGLVLQNNAGDDLPVGADGAFDFATKIESGQPFSVTVKTQPSTPSQACVVTGGDGTVGAGNVVSVSVNCTTNKFTAGGTVSGLDGTGLVLTSNGVDLPLNLNGGFAFPAQTDGTSYAVTVKTQPTNKWQTCSVTNGSGSLAGSNVTNIAVSCTTNTYSIGGTLSGLTGTVVLTNNGGNDLPLTANGNFTFTTKIASGSTYAVAVKTQPVGKLCFVTNGSGTVSSADVSNVQVVCTAHNDGFNHTWNDGVPDGTYNATQGVAACKAWSSASGFNPAMCQPTGCGCSDGSLCAYNPQTNNPLYVWFYSGPKAGQVTNNSCSSGSITWR